LTNAQVSKYSSSIKKVAANDLMNEFEQILRNEFIFINKPIQSIQSSTNQLRKIFPRHSDSIIPNTLSSTAKQNDNNFQTTRPGSILFEMEDNSTNFQLLIHQIKMLTSPELILRLAAFVSEVQPEAAIIDENFSINFGIMSKTTLSQIQGYVKQLLLNATIGKIDPFARSFGQHLHPFRIQFFSSSQNIQEFIIRRKYLLFFYPLPMKMYVIPNLKKFEY